LSSGSVRLPVFRKKLKVRPAFALYLMILVAVAPFQGSSTAAQTQGGVSVPPPFNSDTMTLGPGYSGADAAVIAEAIQASGITSPKGEYETSAAYAERQRTAVRPSQPIAFLLNTRDGFGVGSIVSTAYNAEKQILSIRLQLSEKKIGGREIFGTYDLSDSILQSDHSPGTTAFGVTADVTNLITKSYSVAIDNGTWLTRRTPGYALEPAKTDLPIKLPPEKAKDLAAHFGVLLVGNLHAPWITQDLTGSSPTLALPIKSADIHIYLHVEPTSLWVFDKRNGKVLFKFSAQSLAEQLNGLESDRRADYPLTVEISSWTDGAYLTYAVDNGEEIKGKSDDGAGGTITKLPVIIEAEHRVVVRINTKSSYQFYRTQLVFRVNGAPVKPKWHTSKDPFLAETAFVGPD